MTKQQFSGPLFVTGIWRSGTSLLYALLNQNPQIALLYEGDLPLLWPLFQDGKVKSDWVERWDFWNGAPRRHHIDVHVLPENVTDIRSATEAVYKQHAGLAIWGCKSPSYFDSMTTLAKDFPQARFIVIWRDPRDIIRSIVRAGKKNSWFKKSGMPLRALLGYREMKAQCDALIARGVPLYQIQYEDMVKDPASAMMAVCRFVGIAYDPKMVSLEGADRSAIYSAEHHALVKGTQIERREQEEVLSAGFKRKIDRYIALWHQEYGGNWPAIPAQVENGARPSFLGRSLDRLRYRLYRALDQATLRTYCSVPLRWLRAYRTVKRYNDGVAVRAVQKPAPPVSAD